jgi:DNA-binding SARP family transcriptional activator
VDELPLFTASPSTHQAEQSQAAMLKVYLLGSFRVQLGGRLLEASAFHLQKGRSLIKLLALERQQRLHREQVIETLWPEAPPSAAMNSLYQVLHATRRVLSGESRLCPYLQFEDEMLVLGGETPAWVDVFAFENAVRQAQWSGTREAYEQALEFYTGELLPEDRYEEWAETHRQRLQDYFLLLLSKLGQYHAAQQDYERAAGVYERLVQADPLNEESVVGWMRSLAGQGLRQQARQLYQELAVRLKQELGVEPAPATRQAYEQLRQAQVKEKTSLDLWVVPRKKLHNLPQRLSSFVGREQELGQVKDLLRSQRLLTLVGAGGVGKSRLALETAWEVLQDYPDGIWLAELAVISDGKLLAHTIESALGVQFAPGQPVEQALENYLSEKYLLLVLDNCEHILDACAGLAKRLLENCPGLRLLATSRTPLGLDGERTWIVPPLSLPDPEHLPRVEDLQTYDAVRLFADRATNVRPGFAVTEQNAALVAQVCRKLDGIPLAIELAAARVGLLDFEQIDERLGRGLDLLQKSSPGRLKRHQTMRLCLDLSHAMLSAGEQTLLRRLAVFAGGLHPGSGRTGVRGRWDRGARGAGSAGGIGEPLPGGGGRPGGTGGALPHAGASAPV